MTALLNVLTLAKARDGLVAGDFSAEELTTAHLEAMESARDLNAFITETPELALERRTARGPTPFQLPRSRQHCLLLAAQRCA